MATRRVGGKAAGQKAAGSNVLDMRGAAAPKQFALGDGLANFLTGMNTSNSKRGGDFFGVVELDQGQLINMYRGDWMSRKGVDIIAEDMTREWRRWDAEPEEVEALEATEERLNVIARVQEGIIYARLFGGAALIVGDGTRNMASPLKIDSVKQGGLNYLVAVPSTRLTPDGQVQWDPAKENFGWPDYWTLTLGTTMGTKIHWTRVIPLQGMRRPDNFDTSEVWGDSVLQAVYEALRNAGLANSSGATMVEEANIDVMTMESLATHLSTTAGQAMLTTRMRLGQLGKSSFRMLLMGQGETYDRKQVNLSNLDHVVTYYMQAVSGAFDIPMTRFLAQSPAGMNSTGESDLRNYASMISSQQETKLSGPLKRLDRMLLRDALGDEPDDVWYEWAPIWSQAPKEAAETNKLHSEADLNYANSGMIPTAPLETSIQNRIGRSPIYPGFDQAKNNATDKELNAKRPEPAPIQEDPNALAKLNAMQGKGKGKPVKDGKRRVNPGRGKRK